MEDIVLATKNAVTANIPHKVILAVFGSERHGLGAVLGFGEFVRLQKRRLGCYGR